MPAIAIPLQILLVIFLLFAFSRAVLRFREGSLTLKTFIFWSGIWILAIIGVLRPELTTLFARSIGIGRGADAVIYISLVLLFYLVYRTNIMLENLHHELTELVRKLSLKDAKPPKNS